MKECADRFSVTNGHAVEVIRSEPSRWRELQQAGVDIYYGGADYMLADFDRESPGILDLSTLTDLYSRTIGIIVRTGNPLGIVSLPDLGRTHARLLDVQLENMEQFQDEAYGGRRQVFLSVCTGIQGKEAWLSAEAIDAWITYRTWHVELAGNGEFLPIPGREDAVRSAPIAVTRDTANRQLAAAFIGYLQSGEAHRIFRKHGWI